MSSENELEPFSSSIDEVFAKLGLPDPVLMSKITENWDELAGKPWVGRSKPLYVRSRTLYVEAASPSMVAILKYGMSNLTETLQNRFGAGVISGIEVVPPGGG